jgi:hypothetical protein
MFVLAQSIGEYAALGSIASHVESLMYSASSWLGTVTPTSWLIIAVVVVGLFFWTRR